MGNQTGKDSHDPPGSPLDFFQTPPATPSEAHLTAMALSSPASSNKAQTPSTPSSTTPSTTSPIADWTQKPSATSELAVINLDNSTSSDTNASDAAARHGKEAISLDSPESLPPSGSPSEQRWQERDGRLEPPAAAECAGDEMTLVLLSLMEHYRASLGLTPNTDIITGAVELLRRLISERDKLVEEVDTLKETLTTERLEWHQFQSDLQVAVSVADRLRAESEEALDLLQESYRPVKEQLSQALSRQQETEKELESLRAEHRDVCCRLNKVILQQQKEQAKQEALQNSCRVKDIDYDKQADRQNSEEELHDVMEEAEAESESKNVEKENEANQDVETKYSGHDFEVENGLGPMTGKRVAEGYLRSLGALEKKKEEGCGQREPRRIVMLPERSWSLSRLPLPTDTSRQNGTSENTSATLPLCKKEEPTKGKRMNRILQRQDSWSSFYTVKQDDQTSDSIMPQDGFSALLRRHGGSRRNSLLRWCQSRTQGYKNIEITNFSSSWEDGLAFCAVYHTFLPTHIPYDSLKPANKKENLALAFKTGEGVGITATLTMEEMLRADGPDWQRVLGYVESIFRHFEM
uniref:cytospin-A-like n=1 Tax=Monopterus albus TaxID=43700 RepID=UPI0009B2F790|nr:cytospin-A-like [Monopterus albus]